MILLPPELVRVDDELLHGIEQDIKSIYRLMVFSSKHNSIDLLSRYQEAVEHLREVLSFKNAQQEAHSEEEAKIYLKHLTQCMTLIIREIGEERTLQSPLDLFLLFRTIAPEAAAKHPNMYRQTNVQFGPCTAPPPGAIGGLIEQLFEVLPTIRHSVLRAVYLHHELIRIHPFVDGNGRVSRMAKNWLLMYELYPPIIIFHSSDRKRYIQTLQNSFFELSQDPDCFGPATQEFFKHEIQRIKASCSFILHRMINNLGEPFGSEETG